MLWRTREKIKRWHSGISPLLLAIAAALAKNVEKARKGEKADATINPLDLIPSKGEVGKETGELKDVEVGDIKEAPEISETTPPEVPQQFAGTLSPLEVKQQFQTNRLADLQAAGTVPQGVSQQPTTPSLPAQNVLQGQRPPGILAGLKQGVLNLPTTAKQIPTGRTGRQAAFATGQTIGDFIRANALKLPTADPLSPEVPLITRTGKEIGKIPRGARFQPRSSEDLLNEQVNAIKQAFGIANGTGAVDDEFAEDRKQLRRGEILIRRGNEIMAVTEKEIRKGDIRL